MNKVIWGDCLQVLKDMPDKSVDLVLTDPPYGLDKPSGTIGKARSKNDYGFYDDTVENIHTVIIPAINECIRVAKRVIVTPGSVNFIYYPKPAAFGCMYQPAASGLNKWGFADAQPIFYYGKDPRSGLTISRNSFTVTERPAKDTGHPCPKPLEFWKALLNKGSLEGETVLDPFLGSGTTAIAAKLLNRKYIGIEIDPHYVDISNKRLRDLTPALPFPLEQGD